MFGVCPCGTEVGDKIVVLLGCEAPLVLHKSEAGMRFSYQVVGECYVPGVMSTESLLGKLPDGWTTSTAGLLRHGRTVYTHGDVITQRDPRISLPAAWEYRYGTFQAPQLMEAENECRWLSNGSRIQRREKGRG